MVCLRLECVVTIQGGGQARMLKRQLVDEDGSSDDDAGFLNDGEVSVDDD